MAQLAAPLSATVTIVFLYLAVSTSANLPGRNWCVPKGGLSEDVLQKNTDFACGGGIDCAPIKPGGACFEPNTKLMHATWAMHAFYLKEGSKESACNFDKTGVVTEDDPSYGSCVYKTNAKGEGW